MRSILSPKILGEFLGTCFLVMVVIGSGIMASKLSDDELTILLANTIATGAGLTALIWVFISISGAHFNPAVTLVMFMKNEILKDINSLNIDFSKGYILEKLVKLKKEISIIITRFNNQKYEIYEPIENKHEDQILKFSKIPADIDSKIYDQSKDWAMSIAEELKYVGTLCVEFFIDRNDNLYVNEIAPRVHNSGHLTINAYNVSQFENHVRAVCGLEQVSLKKISNATMVNLIGDQISKYRKLSKFRENEFFFDYLKKEIKEKRKMGHITTLL